MYLIFEGIESLGILRGVRNKNRGFPSGSVTKTSYSQCRGLKFHPCSGNQIPYYTTKNSHAVTKNPYAKKCSECHSQDQSFRMPQLRPGSHCSLTAINSKAHQYQTQLKKFFLLKDNCFTEFCCFSVKPQKISHGYTYILSLLNLPPISLPIPPLQVDTEPLFKFPEPYSKFPLSIY